MLFANSKNRENTYANISELSFGHFFEQFAGDYKSGH